MAKYTAEEVDKFIKEQAKIVNEAVHKVNENALNFHRAVCTNPPGSPCEKRYMMYFSVAFKQELDAMPSPFFKEKL